jgi:hypothetical protein
VDSGGIVQTINHDAGRIAMVAHQRAVGRASADDGDGHG